jgi:DNA-dependent RNA polymerase auxiliary subunit epsilon
MEEFGDTTESLYLHIADNYDFRKLTKKKATQLLKAKI